MVLSSPRARAPLPPSSPSSSPRRCRVAASSSAAVAAAASPRAAAKRTPGSPAHRLSSFTTCRAASFSSNPGEQDGGGGGGRPTSTSPAPAPASAAAAPAPLQTLSPDDLPPPPEDAYASAEAAERLWRRLVECRRELAQAVEREDFSRAATLRDEARGLSSALPPVRQYVLHQLERLRTGQPPAPLSLFDDERSDSGESGESGAFAVANGGGSSALDSKKKNKSTTRGIRAEQHADSSTTPNDGIDPDAAEAASRRRTKERLAALAALAETGDAAVLPDLARALRDPELQPAAQDAMWAVFGRSPDPRVAEMMEEGGKLLGAGAGGPGGTNPSLEAALAAFDRVLELSPQFAEAHNKRATVLYLLGRHEQAVSACEACLAINPWHFGAASGAGLCHVALQQPAEALRAFERALEIHPGLTQIARYAAALRLTLEERERVSGGGVSEGEEGDGGSAAAP
jgi:tetratricopeptide (TPR) repeat protein